MLEMKRLSFIFVCVLLNITLIYSVNAQSIGDTLVLTQEKAIDLALQHNSDLEASRLNVEYNKHLFYKELGRLLPQVDFKTNYNYTIKKQRLFFGGGDSNAKANPMSRMFPEEGIEVGVNHNLQAGVQAGVPILAPALWASLGLSKAEIDFSLEKALTSEQNLSYEVQKTYLNILLSQDVLQTLEESYQLTEEHFVNVQAKYKEGLASEYDVLRLETQLKNLQPDLIRARQRLELVRLKLKVLLNEKLDRPLLLKEHLSDFHQDIIKDVLQEEEDNSLSQNPLLRQLNMQKDKLKLGLLAKRMTYLPSLRLSFLYNYNYASNTLKLGEERLWNPYSMVGLTLTIPLTSRGSRYNDICATKIQMQQLELKCQQTKAELQLGLEQMKAQLGSAKEEFLSAQSAIKLAYRGLEIARERYDNGLCSVLELNDTELSYRKAQLNLNQATFDYLSAKNELIKLKGKGLKK